MDVRYDTRYVWNDTVLRLPCLSILCLVELHKKRFPFLDPELLRPGIFVYARVLKRLGRHNALE